MVKRLRFGFDIGTNSIGWAVIEGQDGTGAPDQGASFVPTRLVAAGARIFSDGRNPKDGSSLAEMRRVPRAARRRRDRLLQRKRKLLALLRAHGLEPVKDLQRLPRSAPSPFDLRARALDEALSPADIGRAFIHINQRRGFLSNRRTDAQEGEAGFIKAATARLAEALAQSVARTLGEFLARRQNVGARFRPSADPKVMFDLYPTRAMMEAEFDAIWSAQRCIIRR